MSINYDWRYQECAKLPKLIACYFISSSYEQVILLSLILRSFNKSVIIEQACKFGQEIRVFSCIPRNGNEQITEMWRRQAELFCKLHELGNFKILTSTIFFLRIWLLLCKHVITYACNLVFIVFRTVSSSNNSIYMPSNHISYPWFLTQLGAIKNGSLWCTLITVSSNFMVAYSLLIVHCLI